MRLTVFGATGGVGREVVQQALDAGHEVTAVVRDPARLPRPDRPGLTVATVADLTDRAALRPVLEGRSAVVSALGPRGRRQAKAAPVTGPALRSVVEVMDRLGVRRLAVVSAAPLGPTPPGEGLLTRAIGYPLLRAVFSDVYADLAVMERVLAASGTEWTVIRPPRLLDRPRTGSYRRVVDGNVPNGRSIGRADVADALLSCLDDPATVRHAVGVSS
ncbi:NAD(P)-dependent oxidoreductase [Kitasatospora sp. NBC_01266]|uniref:NAD(P)-dependent oxidoreductase n=1 Tax=Kitasatospora sp. NBC_01266 TaxID=2903572 RepID=UPI002E3730E8|nr:SDR family oxidoreductase [Kitasatospora sp. NBC_01266]